jgi:hypothetical protein
MTQSYLDDEIALARQTYMYYTDKLYDYLTVGSDKYQVWYRDSLQLYYLLMMLESVIIVDDVAFIGYYEFEDETVLRNVFDKVREYYLVETETIGVYGDPNMVITVPTTRDLFMVDWKEIIYDITVDNTLTFPLPFTYTNIDPETLIVTIEGYGAIKEGVEDEGFHITGNAFYWHHYFNLDTGMKVHFRYKQIAGL